MPVHLLEYAANFFPTDAPPLEELKDEVKTPNDTTHMWDVELMWTYQHKDEYKPECYVKDLQLKCAGMDNVVNVQVCIYYACMDIHMFCIVNSTVESAIWGLIARVTSTGKA